MFSSEPHELAAHPYAVDALRLARQERGVFEWFELVELFPGLRVIEPSCFLRWSSLILPSATTGIHLSTMDFFAFPVVIWLKIYSQFCLPRNHGISSEPLARLIRPTLP